MRAVLDPNVIISGVLSPRGAPGRLLRLWVDGSYDMVVSPLLLDELGGALARPKLQVHVTIDEAGELLELLASDCIIEEDSSVPLPVRSRDPNDDYLIALADSSRSILVSGDRDLLELAPRIPVFTPAGFLEILENET